MHRRKCNQDGAGGVAAARRGDLPLQISEAWTTVMPVRSGRVDLGSMLHIRRSRWEAGEGLPVLR